MIAPQTDVYLLKVPLEISDLNQLTFDNATSQYNYFSSLPKIDLGGDFTYQRKDGTIRVPALVDDILEYNYVMYRNEAYSNKWFYAYITNMEWLNDNVTLVSIKSDVWQCWQFNLQFKPVLIDREHTNDDTIGANTLPEGLETGEYIANNDIRMFGPMERDPYNYYIVVDVSMVENTGDNQSLSSDWSGGTSHETLPIVNGVPSGVYHLLIPNDITHQQAAENLRQLIDVYDNAGLGNAIQNIYILPKKLIGETWTGFVITSEYVSADDPSHPVIKSITVEIPQASESATELLGDREFPNPSTRFGLHDYWPVNNKLYCWPYCFFNVSNNAGSMATYHYEDFSDNIPMFRIVGALSPSGSVKCYPRHYKKLGSNSFDYAVTGAKYPMCAWINDSYTNWLTQNAINMRTEKANAIADGISGIISNTLTGAYSGASTGGVTGAEIGFTGSIVTSALEYKRSMDELARNQNAAKGRANIVPDQATSSANVGDLMWAELRSDFTYLPMCIKPEYARCIDEYFSQYGYKCNRVKVPNITGRRNWNYVKTVGCYIEGDVPQADLNEIKLMFDKGITLWHNPATFADYNQNNDII